MFFSILCLAEKTIEFENLEEVRGFYYEKYRMEKYTGKVIERYPTKEIRTEVYIKDGKLDGPFKKYEKTGQITFDGGYKNGLQDGPTKTYYETGQIAAEGYFKDGKQVDGFKKYYKNGNLYSEGFYIDGKLEGLYKEYTETGELKHEWIYKDGVFESYVGTQKQRKPRERKKYTKEPKTNIETKDNN